MKTLLIAFFSLLMVAQSAHAETVEQKFERIKKERSQAAYKQRYTEALLAEIKAQGFHVPQVELQIEYCLSQENRFAGCDYVTNGKAVCQFDEPRFRHYMFRTQGLSDVAKRDLKREGYVSSSMSCLAIAATGTSLNEVFANSIEILEQKEFVKKVQEIITAADFDPLQFAIPSDSSSRSSVEVSRSRNGLYLQSSQAICRVYSLRGYGLQADCIKLTSGK